MVAPSQEIPVQIFTKEMSIARSLMRKSNPSYDDAVQLSDAITAVYKQPFNYPMSTPIGLGSHIDFALIITGDANRGEVAKTITNWLRDGTATIFSFNRVILDLNNIFETRLAIEKRLLRVTESVSRPTDEDG